ADARPVTARQVLVGCAPEAADAAAAIIRDRARDATSLSWQLKSHSDFVSEGDTAAERAIRGVLRTRVTDAAGTRAVPRGDRYTATRGGGATRNGEPIRVSPITDASKALIGTGFPFKHLAYVETAQH